MTLIVSLQGKDGLVIAADSRGTIGDPRGLTAINDDQTKLFQLSKFAGIGISGSAEFAAKVVDELKRKLATTGHQYADDILNETRCLVRTQYDDWFAKMELNQRPSMALTLVGYHQETGGALLPRTYLLVSAQDFAPNLFPKGNSLAGVPQYAVYLMHRLYVPEMTVSDLTRLAAYLISETATQDPKVGGPIRMATINPTAGYREMPPTAVQKIIKKNEEQSEQLKQFFFDDAGRRKWK